MAFIGQFNVKTLPQDTNSFTPLPAGWYDVHAKASDLKSTKSGDGTYINLQLLVDGPSHAGRSLWAKLNITNKNQKAEEIGRAQLRTICEAAGIEEISDTDQLVGARFACKVVVIDSNWQGEPDNEIKGFKASSGASTMPKAAFGAPPAFAQQAQSVPAFAQQSAPAPVASVAPWAQPATQQAAPATSSAPPWAAR